MIQSLFSLVQLHDWIDLLQDFSTTNTIKTNTAHSLDFRLLNGSLDFWHLSFPCTVHWWHATSRVPVPLWSSSQCWDWLPHTNLREAFPQLIGDAAQGLRSLWGKWDHSWWKGKENLLIQVSQMNGASQKPSATKMGGEICTIKVIDECTDYYREMFLYVL